MKTSLFFLFVATGLGVAIRASAQEGPTGAAAGTPKARVGFQMALRTGYSVPMGHATGAAGGEMSNAYSGQVPIFVEIGGKPIPNLFIGGYLGLGFGGAAGGFDTFCSTFNATCVAVDARFGAEIQYHMLPDQMANPWIGYGIGFESAGLGISVNGHSYNSTQTGFEFAHFMGGVDFRLSRAFGLGPFFGLSFGQYSRYHIEFPGLDTQEGDIAQTGTHEWLSVGVRGVFFP